MTYFEVFETVKHKFADADVSAFTSHCAFEFDITGDGEGKFYAEIKDGQLFLEPYDYVDYDARLTASAETLLAIVEGKLDPIAAFTLGRLRIDGNVSKAMEIEKVIKSIKKNAKIEAKADNAEEKAEPETTKIEEKSAKIEEKPLAAEIAPAKTAETTAKPPIFKNNKNNKRRK